MMVNLYDNFDFYYDININDSVYILIKFKFIKIVF